MAFPLLFVHRSLQDLIIWIKKNSQAEAALCYFISSLILGVIHTPGCSSQAWPQFLKCLNAWVSISEEIGCLVKIILLFRSQKTQYCLTHIATNLGQSFSKEWVCGYFLQVKREERKDISV